MKKRPVLKSNPEMKHETYMLADLPDGDAATVPYTTDTSYAYPRPTK
jgi:hypothetical protein